MTQEREFIETRSCRRDGTYRMSYICDMNVISFFPWFYMFNNLVYTVFLPILLKYYWEPKCTFRCFSFQGRSSIMAGEKIT